MTSTEVGRPDTYNAIAILDRLIELGPTKAPEQLKTLVKQYNNSSPKMWTKAELLATFRSHYSIDSTNNWLPRILTKKPIRSLSGITSLTVLTKPFPCPGQCIFCPVDVRMPKSYIATEPGAQRAGLLGFDPYLQVSERLRAYQALGHPVSKIELIVLGGSWSAYPREYQRWFVKRLFDALNEFADGPKGSFDNYPTDWGDVIGPKENYNRHINASKYVKDPFVEVATEEELIEAQNKNEVSACRCVGLSLETRPDLIDSEECTHLRFLGATKIQIGIQSLNDKVLKANKRGHRVKQTEAALVLLRKFGFKIQSHWMPNLYESTPDEDIVDFSKLFSNPAIKPDELKVYPTALIQDTELEKLANQGKWQPYTDQDLRRVLEFALTNTPQYCRISRVIRDIPAFEILAGNKQGDLRQDIESSLDQSKMNDIRAREVKSEIIEENELVLDILQYQGPQSSEFFLQYIRPSDRKLAGFLRLSLPQDFSTKGLPKELKDAGIIREVHVYGQSTAVGDVGAANQHQGLGRQLIATAEKITKEQGLDRLAVISAIGTRLYYEKLGFSRAGLYQTKQL